LAKFQETYLMNRYVEGSLWPLKQISFVDRFREVDRFIVVLTDRLSNPLTTLCVLNQEVISTTTLI
jgi:hypothetical protein